MDLLENAATRWLSRSSAPRPEAVAAVHGLTPAIVITGGSSGIGLALARQFAKRAEAVVLVARTQSRLDAAVEALRVEHTGVRIEALALDVSEPDAPGRLSGWLSESRLYCDVLVNNAAIGQSGPYSASDTAKLEALLATNVAAVARLTRAVLPAMLARGRGGILTVSSLGGLIPGPHQAAYYASKAFVVSLSEAIASETAGQGIRVTVVLPGPVETRFHAKMDAEGSLYRHFLAAASPDRVARLALRGYRLGRRVVAPGLVPTLAVPLLRFLPHSLTLPIIRWLLDTGRTPLPQRPPVS